MTGLTYGLPSTVRVGGLVERPGVYYDPRPTTTELHNRDQQIAEQRKHLYDIDLWAKRLRGPCVACRWAKGGEYRRCTNPAVAQGKGDPVSGEVHWSYPLCEDERRPKRLPLSLNVDWHYASDETKEVHAVRTLCGPEGLLFEPRTTKQFLTRWALLGLLLVPLLVLAYCAAHG